MQHQRTNQNQMGGSSRRAAVPRRRMTKSSRYAVCEFCHAWPAFRRTPRFLHRRVQPFPLMLESLNRSIVIGGQDVIIDPITGSQMFFRLTQ
jgi:hypothetical protein